MDKQEKIFEEYRTKQRELETIDEQYQKNIENLKDIQEKEMQLQQEIQLCLRGIVASNEANVLYGNLEECSDQIWFHARKADEQIEDQIRELKVQQQKNQERADQNESLYRAKKLELENMSRNTDEGKR